MSKYGRRYLRRGVMNSKMGNAAYYKGRGAANEGSHTAKGAYVVREGRRLSIVAPPRAAMAETQLRPYVHAAAPRPRRGERVAPGEEAAAPGGGGASASAATAAATPSFSLFSRAASREPPLR
jgi:hypothetical protein